MPKTDGPYESESGHELTSIIIFTAGALIGIILMIYYGGILENNAYTRHLEHEALDHPCLISDNGKIAVIDKGWCANSHSNSITEIQYFKDKGYTITGVSSGLIYMEKQNGFRAFN